jgi:hydroxymethylglutaryl-CoA synthase
MAVGIEKINLYGGRFYADALELAALYGRDVRQVMVEERSVVPPFEDSVTMAVNAAKRLLGPGDAKNVDLVIVATESAVDYSKPVSTWVQRFCGLPANCRSFEVKHACYSATGALKMSLAWVASQPGRGKKVLLISSDLTRADLINSGYDFIGGGCSVAMLISDNPQVLEIELGHAGYWTEEICDTHRPTAAHELVHNEKSLFSYLDALDGAFDHYEEINGKVDYESNFKKHIYHAPFPGMAYQAHQLMMNRMGLTDKAAIYKSFEEKVEEGLLWPKRLGTGYGASNFLCLMGLLESAKGLQAKDRISMFSYGSGCQGEFYDATIGEGAIDSVRSLDVREHLDGRLLLNPDLYRRVEDARQGYIDCRTCKPVMDELAEAYESLYEGKGLLVLKGVNEYEREYGWS